MTECLNAPVSRVRDEFKVHSATRVTVMPQSASGVSHEHRQNTLTPASPHRCLPHLRRCLQTGRHACSNRQFLLSVNRDRLVAAWTSLQIAELRHNYATRASGTSNSISLSLTAPTLAVVWYDRQEQLKLNSSSAMPATNDQAVVDTVSPEYDRATRPGVVHVECQTRASANKPRDNLTQVSQFVL